MLSTSSQHFGKASMQVASLLGLSSRHSAIPVFAQAASSQRATFASKNWNFPKHKELLTEDFYDDETGSGGNPYAK